MSRISNLPNGWEFIRLNDVLEQQYRQVELQEGIDYIRLGVRWYAGGTFAKDKEDGDGIASRYLNQVASDDFIYNRMFAWKGSFAVVPSKHDGHYVSNEFPLFRVTRPDILLPEYLLWFAKREYFWTYIEALSTGTTSVSRLRYKEDDFLREQIPLPPLSEQRRIAEVLCDADANITAIDTQITDAQEVKRGAMQKLLSPSRLPEKWCKVRLGTLLKKTWDRVDIIDDQEYTQVTVKMHNKGAVVRGINMGRDIGTKRQNRLHTNQLIISKIDARNGAIAIVPSYLEGAIATFDFPTYEISAKINNLFFNYYISTHDFVERCRVISIGTTNRSRMRMEDFPLIPVLLPPMNEQCEIADILQAHDNIIRALQSERDELVKVKRGLMQKLLGGEVRV